MTDRVDPQPIWDLIAECKAEAVQAGYRGTDPRTGWFFRLTGRTIHHDVWEHRIVMARRRGWIRSDHLAEFMAMAAQKQPLEPRPTGNRDPAPRLPSAPLRPFRKDPRELEERISIYLIDEICIKQLGVHPSAVYGQAWWDAA